MKKYLLKLTALVLFVGTLVGCSEDKVFYDGTNGPALAQFLNTEGSFGVRPQSLEKSIPVQLSTKTNAQRSITASIDPLASSENVSEFIEVVPASSFVPAGEYIGNVVVRYKKGYEDITFDTELIVVLKLDAVEGGSVEKTQNRFDLTVFKSCDFVADNVGTEFNGVPQLAGGAQADGFDGPEFTPIITQSATKPNEFTVNTLWGKDFIYAYTNNSTQYKNKFPAAGTIVVNDDLSLTITPSTTGGSPYPASEYIIGATGTYDPCRNVFVYTLTQNLIGNIDENTVTVTLTPPVPPVLP